MKLKVNRTHGITHSLTPFIQQVNQQSFQYPQEISREQKYLSLYQKQTHYNPHKDRSRKHRLLQERNTDIQRENRRLYEKLRKIKLKNAYQSQQKLLSVEAIPQAINFGDTFKPLSLPQVRSTYNSMNKTKSQINSILTDRKTFVHNYFEELTTLGGRTAKTTEELGAFICNGWNTKVLLVDGTFVLVRGKKGSKQLTKKYLYEKVKNKISNGLFEWVKAKFQLQD